MTEQLIQSMLVGEKFVDERLNLIGPTDYLPQVGSLKKSFEIDQPILGMKQLTYLAANENASFRIDIIHEYFGAYKFEIEKIKVDIHDYEAYFECLELPDFEELTLSDLPVIHIPNIKYDERDFLYVGKAIAFNELFPSLKQTPTQDFQNVFILRVISEAIKRVSTPKLMNLIEEANSFYEESGVIHPFTDIMLESLRKREDSILSEGGEVVHTFKSEDQTLPIEWVKKLLKEIQSITPPIVEIAQKGFNNLNFRKVIEAGDYLDIVALAYDIDVKEVIAKFEKYHHDSPYSKELQFHQKILNKLMRMDPIFFSSKEFEAQELKGAFLHAYYLKSLQSKQDTFIINPIQIYDLADHINKMKLISPEITVPIERQEDFERQLDILQQKYSFNEHIFDAMDSIMHNEDGQDTIFF